MEDRTIAQITDEIEKLSEAQERLGVAVLESIEATIKFMQAYIVSWYFGHILKQLEDNNVRD